MFVTILMILTGLLVLTGAASGLLAIHRSPNRRKDHSASSAPKTASRCGCCICRLLDTLDNLGGSDGGFFDDNL